MVTFFETQCSYLLSHTKCLHVVQLHDTRAAIAGDEGDIPPNIPTGGTTCFMSPQKKFTKKSYDLMHIPDLYSSAY